MCDILGRENGQGNPGCLCCPAFFATQAFVNSGRVAILGYGMGGAAVLSAVERGPLEHSEPDHFRAAIAYYPGCDGTNGLMTVPTLILIGDSDDWNQNQEMRCNWLVGQSTGTGRQQPGKGGELVKLGDIFPGATNSFDRPDLPQGYFGHNIQYDANAAKDAEARMRALLHDVLGGAAGNH